MADLTNILGGAWSPPKAVEPDPPELQLLDAMQAAGLTTPQSVQLDGKLHRFNSGTKGKAGHDKSGWYIAYGDGVPAGRFGCWRAGIEITWRADVGRNLSPAEEMAHARRMAEAKATRDAELKRQREIASDTVETIWTNAGAAHPDHPYLARKGIAVHGARVTGDGRLVVPLYLGDHLASVQYIDHEGGKLYHTGGQTLGCHWMVGTLDEPGTIYIAEGFATAATIHEATNRPCVVAYSASNIVPVLGTIRERYGPSQEVVIVADNDASGTGQKYAEQACAKHGARLIVPPLIGDANDYAQAGHDLKILLAPPLTDWLIPADSFCMEPAPIKWLVKKWVQENALIMVHGPSGGGKTFVVLDWSLHMAAGIPEWHGHKVKAGPVVYLAGEGHHGLRGRVAAWRQHHNAGPLDMWISGGGCDLNTPEGYSRVVDAIRADLPKAPNLIVVDTLHRFLAGDENSSQDAKTMIDACANLMAEFNCSVLLVHHTGVSDETQHRARGSSAWKGALEIEISVIPPKGDAAMQIVQRKSKDAEEAEPIFASLKSVAIRGWFDEDGEPVTSAVLVGEDAPPERKRDSKLDGHRKTLERAWWAGGAEVREDAPYVSRSILKDLLTKDGNAERTVRNMVNPSYPDKMIGALIQGEIIEALEHGWIVVDDANASAMMLSKGGAIK